jgi:Predicted acyltransferases
MSENEPSARKVYLDNIRSFTILLVVVYHVAYVFNSVGVIRNITMQGIPAVDSICYFVYPWFMCLMFLVAGISARYSLQARGDRQFAKERVQKLIVPYFGGMFLIGWLNGWVTAHYADMFGGQQVPGIVKYLVYCQNVGPLWFLLELFLASMILLLLRRVDRKDRLCALAGKANLPILLLLALPVWGSSFILNTPVVVVFRNGIYWLMFLLGYYVFSHDGVLDKLKQAGVPLLIIAVVLGFVEVWYFFGKSFASDACLQHPLTNLYLWMMILAILGCAQRWLDFSNSFTKYVKKRSFGIYVCHYPLMITAVYFIITYAKLPMSAIYLITLFLAFAVTIPFYEITSRIPVIRYLLFGIKK